MLIPKKPELLVPAGDFDCVRAGVQNGADAIYLGASLFSARASARNFSISELEKVIKYCKIRNVKTHLTINTLLDNSEFEQAFELAKSAYKFGIDAIIVQDLGFACALLKSFPNMEIHASTQMSVHNLEGVLELEKIGFKRVVLSRELSISEIEYIRANCNVELEVFIHGALCISYSGQCLFSSLVGGRSGNRGKCAQPCRLPYELLESNNSATSVIDKGYLLSTRDLCSLELLPELIHSGIDSFKIEGRMKTPEYVATVTRIYRKYIDLACSDNEYSILAEDKQELLQVFNRGGFSTGHLKSTPNKDLIFPQKPNNMGLYVGNISKYNPNKGYITLELNEPISIGDTIAIEGESGNYTVSELLFKNANVKSAKLKSVVTLGRMKGNIKVGRKVFKTSSKNLNDDARITYFENANLKKIPLNISISIRQSQKITMKIFDYGTPPFYKNICVEYVSDIIPEISINNPITKDRIITQISKLGNTPYTLNKLNIELDDNLYVNISSLNDIRRNAISLFMDEFMKSYLSNRNTYNINSEKFTNANKTFVNADHHFNISDRKTCVLLENLHEDYSYSNLKGFDNVYIPLKYIVNKKYSDILLDLSSRFKMYIYMPTIIKTNYKNLLLNSLDEIVEKFNVHGFVISNIAGIQLLKDYISNNNFEIIANYTMNIFNNYTIDELKKLGITTITPSVEANSELLQELINNSTLPTQLIAYGAMVLMNSSYCLLGKTNNCYPECKMRCKSSNTYYLKDRLGFKFRIMPDNIQTVTSIYNSKITSIDTTPFNVDSVRIDILDENIDEINNIVQVVKSGKKLSGNQYTNGNLHKNI